LCESRFESLQAVLHNIAYQSQDTAAGLSSRLPDLRQTPGDKCAAFGVCMACAGPVWGEAPANLGGKRTHRLLCRNQQHEHPLHHLVANLNQQNEHLLPHHEPE
jgi:hypothetical protein